MNRIYSKVWNRSLGQLVVASELASANRKSASGAGRSANRTRSFGVPVRLDRSLQALAVVAALSFTGMAAAATNPVLGPNQGIFINDGTDNGCSEYLDMSTNDLPSATVGLTDNAAQCGMSDKSTQVNRTLFYNPNPGPGWSRGGSTSLTLGNELYVNGGKLGLSDQGGFDSNGNPVAGTYSMRIGSSATMSATVGQQSIAIGSAQTSGTDGSTSAATQAVGDDAIAVGSAASASKANAIALGTGASSAVADSVALGANSVGAANATGDARFSNAAIPTGGAVSVGSAGAERQIKNVAGGTADTDAVNVAQLEAAADSAVQYDEAGKSSVTLGGAGATAPVALTNVKDGNIAAGSTDAVNGSQLNAVSEVANEGWNVATTASGTGTATGSSTANVKPGDTVTYDAGNNIAMTQNGETVGIATSMAPVFTSVTAGNSVLNTSGLTITGGPSMTTAGINAGNQKITAVAAGAAATDAVNLAQLQQAVAAGGGAATHYYSVNGGATGSGSNYDNDGATGANALAAGPDAQALAQNDTAIGPDATAGVAGTAGDDQSVAIGAHATATGNQSTALGNNAFARGDSGVAIGGDDLDRVADKTYTATVNGTSRTDTGAGLFTALTGSTAIQSGTYHSPTAGDGSVALGPQAMAGGTNAGANASDAYTPTGEFDVAIGAQAQATGFSSIALGTGAQATADTAFAIGPNAQATATSTLAIGTSARASSANALAIGTGGTSAATYTQSSGAGALAIGGNAAAGANASGTDAIAIGGQSTGAGTSAIAVGRGAAVSKDYGIALGDSAAAANAGDVALGQNSTTSAPSTGPYTVNGDAGNIAATSDTAGVLSVGSAGKERQIQNVAAGTLSAASTDAVNGSQLYAVGTSLNNLGSSTATNLGGGSTYDSSTGTVSAPSYAINGNTYDNVGAALDAATTHYFSVNDNGVQGGNYDNEGATGAGAIAVGKDSSAVGANSITLGNSTRATGEFGDAVVIGEQASSEVGASVTIGNGAASTSIYGAGVSSDGSTYSNGSIAIGSNSQTHVDGSTDGAGFYSPIAIGAYSSALADGSIAVGESSSASKTFAIAMGVASNASAVRSLALGNAATANGVSDIAIGANSAASSTGTDTNVALGANSVADGSTLATAAYNPGTAALAGTAPVGEVAVGSAGNERRITSVAAGANDTDAVNVSQLKSVASDVSNLSDNAVQYDDGTKGSVTLGGAPSADGGATGGTTITNVHQGDVSSTSMDAVNGSQLYATNQQVATNTNNITTLQGDVATNTTNIGNLTNGKIGPFVSDNSVTAAQPVSSGANASAGGFGATATGAASTVLGNQATDNGNADATVLGQGASIAAGTAGSNVALGQGSEVTSAAVATPDGTVSGTHYAYAGGTPAGLLSVGTAGNERQITNVAAGQVSGTSTDAVNGSQLFATNTAVTTLGTTVTQLGNTTAAGLGGGSSFNSTTGTVTTSLAVGGNTYNNVNDALTAVDATASKGWNLSANGGAATNVAPGGTVDVSAGGSGNIAVTQSGTNLTIDTNPDLTATSVTTGNTVLNSAGVTIAGGTNGTVSLANTGLDNGGNTIANVAAGVNATDAVNLSQLQAAQSAATTHYYSVNDGGAQGGNYSNDGATGTNALAAGVGASATNTGSTALGSGATASANAGDVALGAGSVTGPVTATTGATIGGTAYSFAGISPTSTVSVGASGNERTITNVAAGQINAASTDAVNGSQLYATNQQVDANATNISNLTTHVSNGTIGPVQQTGTANQLALVAPGGTGAAPGAAQTLTNVAPGVLSSTSTDAVNGSQLDATNGNVATNTTAITNLGNTITNIAGDTSTAYTDANGVGIRYARTNEAGLTASDAFAQGQGSTALGYNATTATTATNAVALGNTATANGANDIAIGANAAASSTGTDTNVALGANSVADGGTLGAVAYNPGTGTLAGTTPVGEVSVGSAGNERRITNVAAGSASTDAVNVSQLQSVATDVSTLSDNAVQYDDSTKGSVTLGGTTSADGGATGGTTITNVHQGDVSSTSTDAVNGSQLYATNQNVANNTTSITNLGNTLTNIAGDTSTAYTDANGLGIKYARTNDSGLTASDAFAQGQGSTALGYNATTATAATNAVALGNGATANDANAVALGAGSATAAAVATSGGTIDGVAYSYAGATPGSTVSIGSAGNERTITNVAAGRVSDSSTDAVNGSQLFATNSAVTSLGNTVSNIAGGGGIKYFHANSTLADSSALGVNSVAIGPNAVAGSDESVALGDGATTANAVATASAVIGGTTYDFAGDAPIGVVSVGAAGSERQIQNVAAGRLSSTSTDAVNGSQLYATNLQVTQNTNDINVLQGAISTINQGGSGMFVSSTGSTGTPHATGTNSAAGGTNAVASGSNSTAVGNDSTASGAGSTAVGNGAEATADNSVAIGTGSVADRDNSVSVGSAGNERQITDVAAGTEATDAVNVGQLKQSEAAAQAGSVQYDKNVDGSPKYTSVTLDPGGDPTIIHNVGAGTADTDAVNVGQLNQGVNAAEDWAKGYTDAKFNSINKDLNTIGNRANGGVASAMAMASLPQAYQPNQSSAAVALGNFHGETGIAVGVSTITESGRYILKLNATTNTRGDAGVGVGAGMVW